MNQTRILVVDDEAIILTQLEESLTDMGYTVVGKASTGAAAVTAAREQKPDIVLMDIVMPGEPDGIGACETIQRDMDIPVILLTAHGEDEILARAKSARPSGYLMKPHRPNQIKACIETSLDRARQELRRVSLVSNARHRSEDGRRRISNTHRQVADDLSMILALMQLQARHARQGSLDLAMDNASSRVLSIMSLQESLYAGRPDEPLLALPYFRETMDAVRNSHFIPERVRVLLRGDDLALPLYWLQRLGVVITELVVNAARHAFGGEQGQVLVSIKSDVAGGVRIVVSDNGNGFPEQPAYRAVETIGLDLVHRLIRSLGGRLTQHAGAGTAYTITLPRPEAPLREAG